MKKQTIALIIFNCLIIVLMVPSIVLVIKIRNESKGLDFCDEDIIVTFDGDIAKVDTRYGIKNNGENSSFTIILPFAASLRTLICPWVVSN